jgi:general secretion pathway protein H
MMPTLVIGTSTERGYLTQHRRSAGFSLLELLVVVAIIAIFVGAAVLSIGITGNDRESEQQISRLKSIIDLVREESLMQSRDYGVFFSESAYRFYTYDYQMQAWLAPADDNFLAEHAIGEPLDLDLVVEDREIVLEDAFDPDDDAEPKPQVLILSSGEMTPFEARISRGGVGGKYVLTAEVDGSMEVTSDGFE